MFSFPLRFMNFIVFLVFLVNFTPSLLNATGAGVLPLTLKEGILYVLLGRELRTDQNNPDLTYNAWSDFGGKTKPGESPSETAYRELQEETGLTSFPFITEHQINKSPYVENTSGYRLYFLYLDEASWVPVPLVQDNITHAKDEGSKTVEKNKVMAVNVPDLLKVLNQGDGKEILLPHTNEPLFPPFQKDISTPEAQNLFLTIKNKALSSPL